MTHDDFCKVIFEGVERWRTDLSMQSVELNAVAVTLAVGVEGRESICELVGEHRQAAQYV